MEKRRDILPHHSSFFVEIPRKPGQEMNDGQRAQKALQLEKEREIMKEIFREKREKIRKDNRISINTEKFVKERDDLNKKLAKDTVGLVHLNQFQKIREDIESEERDATAVEMEWKEEEEKKRRRRQQAASKLSFELDEDSVESVESAESFGSEELSLVKKSRLGADPTVKSYFEASDYAAATSAAMESSKDRSDQEKRARDERRKTSSVRLTLSFYDGADHRFCVDFKRGDRLDELLKKCQKEYGPLKGVLLTDLMLVKENLILPLDRSVFDLEEMGALKDGGRGPYHNSDLFSFVLQAKDQKAAHSGDPTSTAPLNPDEMIETDASRNAKICSKVWFERNKNLVPAKYWFPFDETKHCRK